VGLTDIKMPVMDGIELAGRILRAGKNTKIILLSAYAEFHLAQQAIDLGIYAYLLKHEIDSAVVLGLLNKISGQLVSESKAGRSRTIVDLLRNRMDAEAARAAVDKFNLTILKGSLYLIVLRIENGSGSEPQEPAARAARLTVDELASIVQEQMAEFMQWELVQPADNEYVCVIRMEGMAGEQQQMQEAASAARRVQAELKREQHMLVSAAVGGPSLPGEPLSKLYGQTADKLAYKIFYRGQAVIRESAQPGSSNAGALSAHKAVLERVKLHFYQGEYEQAQACLKKLLLDEIVERKDLTLLNKAVDELLLFVRDFVSERNPEHTGLYDPYKLHEEVHRLDSVYRIYEWFALLFRRLQEEYDRKYSLKLLKALHYIHRHFNEDIGLEELARVMDVSPIYASQLFKKEVGESYKTYLTRYRIKIAVELLRTGSYKIYEIGERVGYQTTAYFCRIFKQVTGRNPSDYEHGGGEG
jgi:two-component system response regulator YesN